MDKVPDSAESRVKTVKKSKTVLIFILLFLSALGFANEVVRVKEFYSNVCNIFTMDQCVEYIHKYILFCIFATILVMTRFLT